MTIVHRLVHAGHIAYFAGGCVRDMLLGLTPKDFDVATSARPDQVKKVFPRAQGVGQAFGVMLIREGQSIIELATFRTDGTYSDGRRPDDVQFASPREDAQRRDFTINGLFFDPLQDKVIDFVGGEADLHAKQLRAIGDPERRFAEDYLRMLRAVRFAARFRMEIEAGTQAAIRANAHKLPRIAPERICDELRAMLLAPTRGVAKSLLERLHLMDVVFRLILPKEDPGSSWSLSLFNSVCGDPNTATSFPLSLATISLELLLNRGRSIDELLSPSVSKEIAQQLRHSFRLSNDESALLQGTLDVTALLTDIPPRICTMKRFLAGPASNDARRLLRGLIPLCMHAERIDWLESQFARFAPDEIAPVPLVTGNELQNAGYTPGPAYKLALDAAYDAQLEGTARTTAEAFAVAESILKRR